LGSVNNFPSVFVIDGKPESVHEYLEDFVKEVCDLNHSGIRLGEIHIPFHLNVSICDAPARSFLKCIINNNGYNCCERSKVVGRSVQRRLVLTDTTAELRCQEEFDHESYMEGHQKSLSPLLHPSCVA